jgi:hypothetical protein
VLVVDRRGLFEFLFGRKIERGIEIDAARQHVKLPGYRRVNFSLNAGAVLSGELTHAARKFLTKQGKHACF